MFCYNCGAEISESSKFCPKCGFRQESVILQEAPDAPGISPGPVYDDPDATAAVFRPVSAVGASAAKAPAVITDSPADPDTAARSEYEGGNDSDPNYMEMTAYASTVTMRRSPNSSAAVSQNSSNSAAVSDAAVYDEAPGFTPPSNEPQYIAPEQYTAPEPVGKPQKKNKKDKESGSFPASKKGRRIIVTSAAVLLLAAAAAVIFLIIKARAAYDRPEFLNVTARFTDTVISDSDSAVYAVTHAADALGYSNALDDVRCSTSAAVGSTTYYRLQQYYEGIPVFGRGVVVSADENGNALSLTGNAADVDEKLSLEPKLSQADAEKTVSAYIKDSLGIASSSDLRISSLNDDLLTVFIDSDGSSHLAYCIAASFNCSENPGCYTFVADAVNGHVYSCRSTASSAVENGSLYGAKIGFTVTKDDETGIYYMMDENRGFSVHLFGSGESNPFFGDGCTWFAANSSPLTSSDSIFGNTDDEAAKDCATAATLYKNVCFAGDFFKKLGFVSGEELCILYKYIDPAGSGKNGLGGVYFSGDSGSVGVLALGSEIDPKNTDIIGHEYTHFVTEQLIGWSGEYGSEAYAVSEAVSDIFGIIIESKFKQASGFSSYVPDWMMYVYRDISDSHRSSCPENLADPLFSADNDPHTNSTVISRIAYLMSKGYNGTEFVAANALSTDQLAELWYRALLMMPSDCTFSECRTLLEIAADSMSLTANQRECIRWALDYSCTVSAERTEYSAADDADLYVYCADGTECTAYTVSVKGCSAGENGAAHSISKSFTAKESPLSLELEEGFYTVEISDKSDDSEPVVLHLIIGSGFSDRLDVYTDFPASDDDSSEDDSENSSEYNDTELLMDYLCTDLVEQFGVSDCQRFQTFDSYSGNTSYTVPSNTTGLLSYIIKDLDGNGHKDLAVAVLEDDGEIDIRLYKTIGRAISFVGSAASDRKIAIPQSGSLYIYESDGLIIVDSEYSILPASSRYGTNTAVYRFNGSSFECSLFYRFSSSPSGMYGDERVSGRVFFSGTEGSVVTADDYNAAAASAASDLASLGLSCSGVAVGRDISSSCKFGMRIDYTGATKLLGSISDSSNARIADASGLSGQILAHSAAATTTAEQTKPSGNNPGKTTATTATQAPVITTQIISYSWLLNPTVQADDITVAYCNKPASLSSGYDDYNSIGAHKYERMSVIRRQNFFSFIDYSGGVPAGVEFSRLGVWDNQKYLLSNTTNNREYTVTSLFELNRLGSASEVKSNVTTGRFAWVDTMGLYHTSGGNSWTKWTGGSTSISPIMAVQYVAKENASYDSSGNLTFPWSEKIILLKNGQPVSSEIYDGAGSFSDGVIPVKRNGKWGYVDEYGTLVLPFEFDACWHTYVNGSSDTTVLPFNASDGYIVVSKDGKYALFNTSGTMLISYDTFEQLRPVYEGMCWVRVNGKWGVIGIEAGAVNVRTVSPQTVTSGTYAKVNTSDGLRLREGPGTNYCVLHMLSNYTPVTICGYTGDWSYVRTSEGLYGWCKTQYLKL